MMSLTISIIFSSSVTQQNYRADTGVPVKAEGLRITNQLRLLRQECWIHTSINSRSGMILGVSRMAGYSEYLMRVTLSAFFTSQNRRTVIVAEDRRVSPCLSER